MEPASPRPPAPRDDRLLWLLLILSWLAIGGYAWYTLRRQQPPVLPALTRPMGGVYATVDDIEGPVTLRIDGGEILRLAGVKPPDDPAQADRAAGRLRELAPTGTRVYFDREPQAVADEQPAVASVYLPPAGATEAEAFPYAEARLLGALLVREGMVRVDEDHPYRLLNEFLALQEDAARHGRGLWAKANESP